MMRKSDAPLASWPQAAKQAGHLRSGTPDEGLPNKSLYFDFPLTRSPCSQFLLSAGFLQTRQNKSVRSQIFLLEL